MCVTVLAWQNSIFQSINFYQVDEQATLWGLKDQNIPKYR